MTPETLRIIDTFSPVELDLWARRGGEVPVQRREELRQWRDKQEHGKQDTRQREDAAVAAMLSMRREAMRQEAERKAKATKRRKAKP